MPGAVCPHLTSGSSSRDTPILYLLVLARVLVLASCTPSQVHHDLMPGAGAGEACQQELQRHKLPVGQLARHRQEQGSSRGGSSSGG